MSVSCSVGRASAIPNNFHAFGEGPRRWPQSVQNTQAGGAMGSQVSPQIEICVLVSSVERSTALLTTFGLRLNIARSTWVCVVSFAGLFGRQATGGLHAAGKRRIDGQAVQLVVGIAPAAEADARISRIGDAGRNGVGESLRHGTGIDAEQHLQHRNGVDRHDRKAAACRRQAEVAPMPRS